jgi:peptidoglycan/xylan/chitin deacetylase (PgdA/CDA1 family)
VNPLPLTPRASTADAICGTLLLYWDYDTQWGADRSRSPGTKNWGEAEFTNTDRLLTLLDEFEIRVTFAVVGAVALPGRRPYHDPAQVRAIHAAGHEVASHSYRHEWLPGLGGAGLRDTLRFSKDALEQCIGAPVVSFVPPFNQPFDHAAAASFSLSERREAGRDRVDLARLCRGLRECGYRTCRVSYRSVGRRLLDLVTRRRFDGPVRPRSIEDVICFRLNTAGGFGQDAIGMLYKAAVKGGSVVAYGHPHSLDREGIQHEAHLRTFLKVARALIDAGQLVPRQPREFV